MEEILHLAAALYAQYTTELFLGLLACILILMIITLLAVRRCRKQILNLTEKTKELAKITLRQSEYENRQRRDGKTTREMDGRNRGTRGTSKEDEEIFGSVIQEMFP